MVFKIDFGSLTEKPAEGLIEAYFFIQSLIYPNTCIIHKS